jgi:hypothetical protein
MGDTSMTTKPNAAKPKTNAEIEAHQLRQGTEDDFEIIKNVINSSPTLKKKVLNKLDSLKTNYNNKKKAGSITASKLPKDS